MDILRFCWCAVWVIGTVNIWGARVAGVWDEIVFGQPSSERRHGNRDCQRRDGRTGPCVVACARRTSGGW